MKQLVKFLRKSKKSIHRGQISLEYLLILVSFFSFFILFFPLMLKIFEEGNQAIELQNAKMFLKELKNKITEVSLYENNSKQVIEVNSNNEWLVKIENKSISLEIQKKINNKIEKITLKEEISQNLNKIELILKDKSMLEIKNSKEKIEVKKIN